MNNISHLVLQVAISFSTCRGQLPELERLKGEVSNPKFHEGIAGRFDGIDSPSRVVHINLVFDYFMPGTPMWKPARIVHWGGFTTQFKPPRLSQQNGTHTTNPYWALDLPQPKGYHCLSNPPNPHIITTRQPIATAEAQTVYPPPA
ncbi:hypothetical protein PSHT_12321 [Puccinia striiformis]|uniref:Uncharacterized protein n=1 Tax=Puccinia striiformis TaxID=27350 RepID=A0A2S4UXN3_9BASI|nr:hypothetical protein PSHT_12321 [Puccinia striiformis]